MHSLPIAPAEFQAQSQQLKYLIAQKIHAAGGWISFAEFMHMALYTPQLGYYSGGAQKFAECGKSGGDFVTAPEISPIFAQTLARQAAQVLALTQGSVLELGAGTGRLAADLLLALEVLPRYYILEVSDYLRQIQRETLQAKLPKEMFEKVVWLDSLPAEFNGLVIANEVLDAVPAHTLHKTAAVWRERGVGLEDEFVWQDKPLSQANLAENLPTDLPVGYVTEVNPAAMGLVRSLIDCLKTGAILLIDYGFSAAEYYHPQRAQGTLMCHYQHYAHDNPLINVGLQDITAHVDFTAVAHAATEQGAQLAGFCSQAQFLINCGMLNTLQQYSPDSPQFMQLAAAAQKLLSPAEMGDLFKVIGFSKNIDEALIGFSAGDKSHTL